MEIYEKICKVIELYNQYKDNLNDDGTVATDEQIAEWIVPSIEDYKEEINEEELDRLANEYVCNYGCEHYDDGVEAYKAGYHNAMKYLIK